mgnify:CR=1 FL=1
MPDWKTLFPDLPAGPALDVGTRFGEFALRLRQAVPAGETVIVREIRGVKLIVERVMKEEK